MAFRGISGQKATGISAVAGGLAEVYVPFCILLTLGSEIAAIVLLVRCISKGHARRSVVSVFSILWSTVVISLFSLLIWLFYFKIPAMAGR